KLGVIALPRENAVCEIPARDEFKFTLPEPEPEQKLYLVGDFCNWQPARSVEMTLDEGWYKITQQFTEGQAVKFIGQQDGWDINFGAESNGDFELYSQWIGQKLSLVDDGQNFKFMQDGTYDISVNLETKKVIFEKQVVNELYLLGNFSGKDPGWNFEDAEAMTLDEQTGKFSITKQFNAGDEFKLLSELNWDNANVFGGQDDNNVGYFKVDDFLGGDITMVHPGANFKVEAAGEYTLVADKENMTLVVTGVNIPVTEIQVENTDVTIELGGQTYQIEWTIVPATATNPAVSFESTDTDVITVDESGLVTAVKSGTWEIHFHAPSINEVQPAQAAVIMTAEGAVPSADGVTQRIDFTVTNPTGVKNVNAAKTVAGKKYVNAAGMVSDKPFDGMNIIVTTYTDGSRVIEKVVK
ncbi:MAG: SusF/SusE family outer membrane protein, partial [Muribaculaceae bacterium]|nr:SusF/SusE family outer membrane protein [Muribaculaceae bacterium]